MHSCQGQLSLLSLPTAPLQTWSKYMLLEGLILAQTELILRPQEGHSKRPDALLIVPLEPSHRHDVHRPSGR